MTKKRPSYLSRLETAVANLYVHGAVLVVSLSEKGSIAHIPIAHERFMKTLIEVGRDFPELAQTFQKAIHP